MPQSSKKKISKKKVSMKELKKNTHSRNAVRAGSTDDIKTRTQQYKKKYPDAKVNYSKTTNKEKAENILYKKNLRRFLKILEKYHHIKKEYVIPLFFLFYNL